ncbi:hypothetical protein CCACVL1_11387 [Corchorus capsularis]|uniref:Uncharacterized protein n=1 Tax=Corchorus capsularis TaxID=210143 RepID=A0A1R3ILM7_COCAP|nr:hypothetical protein CCACVL1_11387 [Corchorus capsularis]
MALSVSDLGALHATITFTILAFIPLLLLKYQKEDTSPFDDHAFILLAFYLATLLYAIAMVTNILLRIRDTECPKIVGNICLLSGPLATISLVFIPFPLVGWFLFALSMDYLAMKEEDNNKNHGHSSSSCKKMPTALSAGDLAAFHAIYGSQILASTPFLLLKFQKSNVSPFDDDYTSTMLLACFISTLIYISAMVLEFKLRIRDIECPITITNVAQLSAPLASISLAMITFPYLAWFLLAIWIVFFVKMAIESCLEFLSLFGKSDQICRETKSDVSPSDDSPV